MKFSETLINAINAVNQDVAADIYFDGGESEDEQLEAVAESCIDANRMTMVGFPEADAELQVLIEEFGYPAVLSEAVKHVSLA